MKEFVRLFVAGVVIVALTFTLFLVRSQNSQIPDYPTIMETAGLSEIIITVPTGASGSEVAQILFENGVTKSVTAYFQVAVADQRSQRVAPGKHRLTKKISASQALDQLLDPTRIPNLIKIIEGQWQSEVVMALKQFGFTTSQIQMAFSSVELPQDFSNTEGLLFPAQYSFDTGVSALSAVQTIVDRFKQDSAGKKLLTTKNKFSAQQLLTIASIVQAEGGNEDFKQVARVIFNRLRLGMPLQMDSTIHYIEKSRGSIFLSTNSTLINSPYNTYKYSGLPPGPIGSPGSLAIDAALNPAVGDWLYFITVAPSDTRFTASFDEFNSWKVLYLKNRKAGAFD